MIHPDDLGSAQAAWDNALHGSNQLHVQFRIVRPDGSIAHVDSLATVVTDPDGSDRRLVGISLDISERVAAEQRERRLQKQLREASHQSGMAEVATGVLHNVGNVLNSLGVASTTAQTRLKAWQIHRVGQVAAMLEENRGSLAEFLTNDERGKRVPEYLASLAARLESDTEMPPGRISTRSAGMFNTCARSFRRSSRSRGWAAPMTRSRSASCWRPR